MTPPTGDGLLDACFTALRAGGAVAVGACGTEPLGEARVVIEDRRARGLSGGMAFTYRNPARSCDPRSALPSAATAVVAAVAYRNRRSDPPPGPVAEVARCAADDAYQRLRDALGGAAGVLREAGHRAVVVADDNALVDRAIARRAGLGWLARSTNLLVPGVGSWVVLGSVLTDADLVVGGPATAEDRCGGCRRCLDGCPTGALVAPGVLDASRCLSWLLQQAGEFPRHRRAELGTRIYGCDTCQEVCPPNRHAPEVPRRSDGPVDWLDLRWLLEASEAELLAELGSWYIPDREARWVRRNALVVLGNLPGPLDGELRSLLRAHLRSDDPMLVHHAAWAARRHRLDELLAEAGVVDHPEVVAESARPVPPPAPGVRTGAPTGET